MVNRWINVEGSHMLTDDEWAEVRVQSFVVVGMTSVEGVDVEYFTFEGETEVRGFSIESEDDVAAIEAWSLASRED